MANDPISTDDVVRITRFYWSGLGVGDSVLRAGEVLWGVVISPGRGTTGDVRIWPSPDAATIFAREQRDVASELYINDGDRFTVATGDEVPDGMLAWLAARVLLDGRFPEDEEVV